ncbi:MAG: hypothetical protein WC717_01410 [Candidatus Micrarchaeia archaeon]|jgi:hypothetical protein
MFIFQAEGQKTGLTIAPSPVLQSYADFKQVMSALEAWRPGYLNNALPSKDLLKQDLISACGKKEGLELYNKAVKAMDEIAAYMMENNPATVKLFENADKNKDPSEALKPIARMDVWSNGFGDEKSLNDFKKFLKAKKIDFGGFLANYSYGNKETLLNEYLKKEGISQKEFFDDKVSLVELGELAALRLLITVSRLDNAIAYCNKQSGNEDFMTTGGVPFDPKKWNSEMVEKLFFFGYPLVADPGRWGFENVKVSDYLDSVIDFYAKLKESGKITSGQAAMLQHFNDKRNELLSAPYFDQPLLTMGNDAVLELQKSGYKQLINVPDMKCTYFCAGLHLRRGIRLSLFT